MTESLARTNRFEVILVPPTVMSNYGREISIMVDTIGFPNMSISAKAFKTWGPNHQMPVGSEYGGEGIAITFLLDGKMDNKRFIEDWMELAVRPNDYLLRYQREYTSSVMISQLNDRNLPIYTVELIDAFPRSMSLVSLDNNAQSQVSRLNVMLAFRRWIRTDKQPSLQIGFQ